MADYIKLDAALVDKQISQLMLEYGEALEDDETLRSDMLEGETDLHSVLARIVDRRLQAEAMVSAIKERAGALKERQSRYERQKDAMTALALSLMVSAKQSKVTLPEATLSVSDGKDSVMVDNEVALPQGFTRTKTEPDKVAIGEALKRGEDVPGAYLQKGEPSLTVRKK